MNCFREAIRATRNHVNERIRLLIDPLANTRDDSKPREPPSKPTPLEFPVDPKDEALGPLTHNADEIYQLFLTIHKTGPTIEHLRSLAVGSCQQLSLENLLPQGFLPDTAWLQDPATTGGSNVFPAPLPSIKTLSNGMPMLGHDVYYKCAKELLYSSEDGFAAIQKKNLPGRPSVRVAIFRKFWDALLQMASYWDTSLDKYSEIERQQDGMDIDQQQASATGTSKTSAKTKQTYTGRRIGTGRDMPPRFREEAVFAFVEAVTLAFRCRVERPRLEPKFKMHNLLIPLQQAGAVYRSPIDRAQARRGILEGPLTAIQCSNQTVFRRPEEAEGQGQGEVANLLREIGLMLNLAQRRAREGQEEPDTSEGKWWVTKPRWGGGPGGEVGDEDGEGSSKGRKRSKKSDSVEIWKRRQPPSNGWDKGVVHLQIGKDKNSEFDDVSLFLHY